MRSVWHSGMVRGAVERVARRRPAVAAVAVEGLELRQLLSATASLDDAMPAAVASTHPARTATPRIDGVAGSYDFFDGNGSIVITQDGLNIHGVTTRPQSEPNGTFDAAFKKPNSKVAKGTGSYLFLGDDAPTPIRIKLKFIPNGNGTFDFNDHYKKLKAV